jgi:hypothetical protein
MATDPSGIGVFSPKIRDQALVRRFVSQYGRGYVAIDIQTPADGPVDPDPGTLNLKVWFNDVTAQTPVTNDPRGVLVLDLDEANLHRADTGKYDYEIGPEHTRDRGVLTVEWTYAVSGDDFTFTDHLQILNRMPLYDSLTDAERLIIEQVSWMMGDLFDSTEGGPYLIEPYQSKFDYERIAQLATVAVHRLNGIGLPFTYWRFGGKGQQSLPAKYHGLAVLATYYELIRHLVRSYVEIPQRVNAQVTYLDRGQYQQRWQSILSAEWDDFVKQVKTAKRDELGLAKGALLVAGGIYGGGVNGVFQYGQYVSATRAFRFYPAAPAVSWGGTR